MSEQAHYGWDSGFGRFAAVERSQVLKALRAAYPDSGVAEVGSWTVNVPLLQREVGETVSADRSIRSCTAVLEYQLPMELRRPDAVLLVRGGVVVLELKGAFDANDAAVDQAHAYARDLRNYHRSCHHRQVTPVVVPTRMTGPERVERNVHICPVDRLDGLIRELDSDGAEPIDPHQFLSAEAYKPLPSLVTAARKLFFEKKPPQLWRSIANTDQAVETVQRIITEARATGSRKLILLTGVPGAGKTLVGLRVAHGWDQPQAGVEPESPGAIFLSGNGPLVDVLQHVLESKAFVRPVKNYVHRLRKRTALRPNENVVIFDEAQRAHDMRRARTVHKDPTAKSEPTHLIEFAERRTDWSAVVGLLGGGQEIHTGEEGGVGLWIEALQESATPASWQVHGPTELEGAFTGVHYTTDNALNLEETIRSHLATALHDFVRRLLDRNPEAPETMRPIARQLAEEGHDLRITRNLDDAKAYLTARYADNPEARYGLVASSRDKDLETACGIPNGFHATKRIKFGPWYNDPEDHPAGHSCRNLTTCVSEFGAQGLELDAVLLAWGTDFTMHHGKWNNDRARGYRKQAAPDDPWQLRANAYRVLLTRARDAHVVFVPPLQPLNETHDYLTACGFRPLKPSPA